MVLLACNKSCLELALFSCFAKNNNVRHFHSKAIFLSKQQQRHHQHQADFMSHVGQSNYHSSINNVPLATYGLQHYSLPPSSNITTGHLIAVNSNLDPSFALREAGSADEPANLSYCSRFILLYKVDNCLKSRR